MSEQKRTRRQHGDGGYRRRGDSWELKFAATDPATGQRKFRYVTFKGTESGARAKLRELVKQADDGAFLAPARQKFSDVLDAWDKTLAVSPKTAERYRELVNLHIRPHLGETRLHSLRTSRIEGFYYDLLTGKPPEGSAEARPLAARTIGHIHRIVVQVLSVAERDGLIASNPARKAKRPKVEKHEIEILTEPQVRDLLGKLRGRNSARAQQFYRLVELFLASGMRRGEGVALRWKDVDLDGAKLNVNQSLEQTKKGGLRFKAPKTKHGRRTITLPAFVVTGLRAHKAAQATERLALGLGKDADDALVFRNADGSPLAPENVTKEWKRLVGSLDLPKVTLHALRHTHASQLIASGMDVLTISRRLGHGSPSITLDVYGHLFQRSDGGAAALIDRAFGGMHTE